MTPRPETKTSGSGILPWALMAALNAVALLVLWRTGWWLHRPDGTPWEHDYIAQWAAGHRVLEGQARLVYDWAEHAAFQARLIGSAAPVELYILYPPHFLFTTPAFAWLGHVEASLAFLAVTAGAYAASLYLLLRRAAQAALVAVAGGGAFYCIWWTQNGFLTAAIFTAALVLLKQRPTLSGVLFGLLTIKPQLGLLVPVALLFGGNWRALAAATATFLALAACAEAFLGAGIWKTFLVSLGEASSFLASGNLWFKQQSIYALVLPTGGPGVATVVHVAIALVVAAVIAGMWWGPGSHWVKSSALLSGSLLATPYLYPYDAVLLTAAAAMLLDRDSEPPPARWERALVYLCCLLPLATRFVFSAAVPVAALVMLYIAVRRSRSLPPSPGGVVAGAR